MEIIEKSDFLKRKHLFTRRLKESIFIYPTDTIYGIGCNAENKLLVNKLRLIKKRFGNPFSVIVPSKEWVEKNCIMTEDADAWLSKLPGPYTLILRLSNKKAVAPSVNLDGKTIGVRMPDNWFSQIIYELGIPIVTTSVNIQGKEFMTSIEDLDPNIEKGVEYLINDGVIDGKPSTLVMLDDNKVELQERD